MTAGKPIKKKWRLIPAPSLPGKVGKKRGLGNVLAVINGLIIGRNIALSLV
jgi:hypothetical protein